MRKGLGSIPSQPGSGAAHPRRATVKRRSTQSRKGVRPGQISVGLALWHDAVDRIRALRVTQSL